MTTVQTLYPVFVTLAGLAMGSLGLLMIGHIMSEHWLAPVRTEAEAAALTMPLLLVLGIPVAFGLDHLFPWVNHGADLPAARAMFLSPGFFILRSICYLLVTSGIALWLIRTRNVRRTSAIGLALLTPIMTFAAYDWVLSREPEWWSSLFGFAFAISQLLAALAGTILITLLSPEHASAKRMVSLERALLTLALLVLWTWFAQFLIVWLANLPNEAAWYMRRADEWSLALLGLASVAMFAAIVVLVPSGVSRIGMIVGSALVLLQHGAHMLWILRPEGRPSWLGLGLAIVATGLWSAILAALIRARPTYVEDATADP
jgi:hypothetical protein